jgi:hypothetical protein
MSAIWLIFRIFKGGIAGAEETFPAKICIELELAVDLALPPLPSQRMNKD